MEIVLTKTDLVFLNKKDGEEMEAECVEDS